MRDSGILKIKSVEGVPEEDPEFFSSSETVLPFRRDDIAADYPYRLATLVEDLRRQTEQPYSPVYQSEAVVKG